MARTCTRCRREYVSGSYYEGSEYCMTCYVRIMEEAARKKAAGLAAQRRKEEDRQKAREQYLVRPKEREAPAARPKPPEIPKRRGFDYGQETQAARKPEEQAMPRGGWAIAGTKGGRQAQAAKKERQPAGMKTPGAAIAAPAEGQGEITLSLSVASGLPVSLSAGQKNLVAVLAGKNRSNARATVELFATITDAMKNPVGCRVEPSQCVLEPEGEQQFSVKFDLKETAASGPLVLAAFLKENAVYVDRPPAASAPVSLTAQVKTPMELAFVPGTAAFSEEGGIAAFCAEFENRGETGGTLSTRSRAGYGSVGKLSFAPLPEKAKVKGLQKKVLLRFSPARKSEFDYVSFELLGADANGKEYHLRKSFRLGKG